MKLSSAAASKLIQQQCIRPGVAVTDLKGKGGRKGRIGKDERPAREVELGEPSNWLGRQSRQS